MHEMLGHSNCNRLRKKPNLIGLTKVEADYIANATENGYSLQNIENFMQKIMKTESGKRILKSIFAL